MTTAVAARPVEAPTRRTGLLWRFLGAALCVAVVYLHIKDQNGFPGEKADDSATWVQVGYYVIEGIGVLNALLLLAGRLVRTGWFLALGVAAGPMVGYVLSRSIGLPSYGGDIGNWFGDAGHPFAQWVDTASFGCEVALLLLAVVAFARTRAHR